MQNWKILLVLGVIFLSGFSYKAWITQQALSAYDQAITDSEQALQEYTALVDSIEETARMLSPNPQKIPIKESAQLASMYAQQMEDLKRRSTNMERAKEAQNRAKKKLEPALNEWWWSMGAIVLFVVLFVLSALFLEQKQLDIVAAVQLLIMAIVFWLPISWLF